MRVRPTARLAALAFVPIFVLGTALPAAAASGCPGSGIRSECCCSEHPAAQPRVARRCCCEIDEQSTPSVPQGAQIAANARGPEISVCPAVPITVTVFAPAAPFPTRAPVVPPTTGPPIILLKRSFRL